MIRLLQLLILSLLFVAPLETFAGNCSKCRAVAPAGWDLCQRCKNEKERLEREESRKKRKAEMEEARKKKEDAEREAKLKKLIEAPTTAPAASETPAAAPDAPKSEAPVAAAKPISEVFPGLFSIRFGQATDATFVKKIVVEDGRSIERHFFTPAKKFRGFDEYSVRTGADGVYEIAAHRRYVKGPGVDAKHMSNAEFNDCAALLGKKFGKTMTSVEESLSGRVSQIRFTTSEGIVCRTVTIKLARNLNTAIVDRYNDNADSMMMDMDRIFDLWIVATDNIALLREKKANEADDIDAL